MKDERESYPNSEASLADRDTSRPEESGEASEPDAPTSAEENDSMSTVLESDSALGVQSDE